MNLLNIEQISQLNRFDWIIDGIISEQGFAIFHSNPNIEKAWPAIDIALSVAHGQSWYDKQVKRGTVVYVLADKSLRFRESVTSRAISKWHKARNLETNHAALRFYSGDLDMTRIDDFVESCRSLGPVSLIIIDDLDQMARNAHDLTVNDILRFRTRVQEELGSALLVLSSTQALRDQFWLFEYDADSIFRVRRYGRGKRFIVDKQRSGPIPAGITLSQAATL